MKKLFLAFSILAAIAAPAFAANEGAYVAAELGQASYSNAKVPGGSGETFLNPGSLRLAGGYHFTPYLGLEAGYSLIGDSSAKYTNATVTLNASAFQVAAIGSYSINRFDVFGKLGMASVAVKFSGTGAAAGLAGSASKANLTFGLGGQYNINKRFAIRAQYENFGKTSVTPTINGVMQTPSDIGLEVIYVGGVYSF